MHLLLQLYLTILFLHIMREACCMSCTFSLYILKPWNSPGLGQETLDLPANNQLHKSAMATKDSPIWNHQRANRRLTNWITEIQSNTTNISVVSARISNQLSMPWILECQHTLKTRLTLVYLSHVTTTMGSSSFVFSNSSIVYTNTASC